MDEFDRMVLGATEHHADQMAGIYIFPVIKRKTVPRHTRPIKPTWKNWWWRP